MRNLFFALLVCFSPAFIVAACSTQPATPQIQYVTRTVTECSWAPRGSLSTSDTPATKRWMIAYETARQTNCPNAK